MYSLKVAFIFNCCILVPFIQHKKRRRQPGKQRCDICKLILYYEKCVFIRVKKILMT